MALSNTSFDGKLSMIIPAWLSANFENVLNGHNAFIAKMRLSGRVKVGGFGTSMVEPIMFPVTSGPQVQGVADPYAEISATPMTGFTAANYSAAEYVIDISIPQYDLDQAGSETEKVGVVQANFENGISRFVERINGHLWAIEENTSSAGARTQIGSLRTFLNGGGSSTTDGGATPAGLTEQGNRAVASASTQTPVFTVGGINRNAAGAAYWATPIINTSEAITVTALTKLVTIATRNSDMPNLILLHRDMFAKLMNLFTTGGGSGGQFFRESELAKAGFLALNFMGADILFDDACPTTCYLNGSSTQYGYNAFAINTDYLKLRFNAKQPIFNPSPDVRPIKRWSGRQLIQLTSSHTGRVHARHVNLS